MISQKIFSGVTRLLKESSPFFSHSQGQAHGLHVRHILSSENSFPWVLVGQCQQLKLFGHNIQVEVCVVHTLRHWGIIVPYQFLWVLGETNMKFQAVHALLEHSFQLSKYSSEIIFTVIGL